MRLNIKITTAEFELLEKILVQHEIALTQDLNLDKPELRLTHGLLLKIRACRENGLAEVAAHTPRKGSTK